LKKEELYFIALVPPEKIEAEVNEIKAYISARFDSKAALRSPPHITLHMPFKFPQAKESKLISSLAILSNECTPVDISINDYGAFQPKVIYLKIEASKELNILQEQLAKWMKTKLKVFSKPNPYRTFTPHMTVAFRDLSMKKFYEAWTEFESKKKKYQFRIWGMYLLKHDGSKWQKHKYLKFTHLI
jgi:2'-5' RNA ligase